MNQLKKIQYNCKQATFLIEKRLLTRITFREHIELRIHLVGCSVCRVYQKQTTAIGKMVQQLFKSPIPSEEKLDDSFKIELQERIDTELNKN